MPPHYEWGLKPITRMGKMALVVSSSAMKSGAPVPKIRWAH